MKTSDLAIAFYLIVMFIQQAIMYQKDVAMEYKDQHIRKLETIIHRDCVSDNLTAGLGVGR